MGRRTSSLPEGVAFFEVAAVSVVSIALQTILDMRHSIGLLLHGTVGREGGGLGFGPVVTGEEGGRT